jgi:FkbM family methyltransferase
MLPSLFRKKLSKIKHWYKIRQNNLPQTGWVEVDRLGFHWRLSMDRYLDRKIVDGSVWELQSVKLIQDLVKPGMCVLDIGANFGYYTLQLARLVEPMGKVIAIEPTQEYASRLEWHLRENNVENVRLERVGFSDKVDEVEIAIGECSATLHWSADAILRLRERIKLVPLDYWWDTYVAEGGSDNLDFLKVDLDGHEMNFLIGAEQTLLRHRPLILIEFSQEALFTAGHYAWNLADRLESMGYILCREEDGQPFENRRALLIEAANFAYSANVLARPS